MKIYLVRHGQTDWNAAGKIQGQTDIGLNSIGIAQAAELGARLKSEELNISAIYSSPLIRARQTAEALSSALDKEVILVDDLREMAFGDWEGCRFDDLREADPVYFDNWRLHRGTERIPGGGECYNDLMSRVVPAICSVIKTGSQENKDLLFVTHGAVLMSLMCVLNHVSYNERSKYLFNNLACTCVESDMFFNAGPGFD